MNRPKPYRRTAQVTHKVIEVVHDAGKFLGEILGPLPQNIIGLAGGDYIYHARLRNEAGLKEKTARILQERGVKNIVGVSETIAIPLLEAALKEGREELQELWAKLLAAARDPDRCDRVRREFVDIVKQMEPLDALLLEELADRQGAEGNRIDFFAQHTGKTKDSVSVSFDHLINLKLVSRHPGDQGIYRTTSLGRELIRACHA